MLGGEGGCHGHGSYVRVWDFNARSGLPSVPFVQAGISRDREDHSCPAYLEGNSVKKFAQDKVCTSFKEIKVPARFDGSLP